MKVSIFCFLFLCCWKAADADHRSGQHWAATTKPIVLGVIKSVDHDTTSEDNNDWLGNWDWALKAWNQLPALELVTVPGEIDSQTRNDCPSEEGYIRVCNSDYGQTGWRGIAKWSYKTYDDHDGHIYQCTVKLNDVSRTYNERKWLCHEIGHCLGLDHTSTDGGSDNSCMDYSSAPSSIGPGQQDYDVLEDVYDHLDWFNSYAFVNQVSCSDIKRAEVAQVCDCGGPEPKLAWANEAEYENCVKAAVQNTACDLRTVLERADCLPFDPPTAAPTKVPTRRPTKMPSKAPTVHPTIAPTLVATSDSPSLVPSINPTGSVSSGVLGTASPTTTSPAPVPTFPPIVGANSTAFCDGSKTIQLANQCDCFGPIPTQAWAMEDEYLQCVDFAVRNTGCELQTVLDVAGCLPFPSLTAMPATSFRVPTRNPSMDPSTLPSLVVLSTEPTSTPTAVAPTMVSTSSPTEGPIVAAIAFTGSPTNAPASNLPTTPFPTMVPTRERSPVVASIAMTNSPTKTPSKAPTKGPTNECTAAELAEVSSICSCEGKIQGKDKVKPWKNSREYEKCVKKATKKSECSVDAVIQVSACYLVFPKESSKSSSSKSSSSKSSSTDDVDSNVECEVYLDPKECKKREGSCQWKKREELCVPKDRRLLDSAEGNYLSLRTRQQHWSRTYVSSKCHSPVKFGIQEDAVLVMASDRSCKYEIRSEGLVEVIDVLL